MGAYDGREEGGFRQRKRGGYAESMDGVRRIEMKDTLGTLFLDESVAASQFREYMVPSAWNPLAMYDDQVSEREALTFESEDSNQSDPTGAHAHSRGDGCSLRSYPVFKRCIGQTQTLHSLCMMESG